LRGHWFIFFYLYFSYTSKHKNFSIFYTLLSKTLLLSPTVISPAFLIYLLPITHIHELSGIVSGGDFRKDVSCLVLRRLSDEPFTCFTMRAISALRRMMIDLFYFRVFIKDRD